MGFDPGLHQGNVLVALLGGYIKGEGCEEGQGAEGSNLRPPAPVRIEVSCEPWALCS